MTWTWLIEYEDRRPSWIAEKISNHSFGITFDRLKARRFASGEEARAEIRKLGLVKEWKAVEQMLPD